MHTHHKFYLGDALEVLKGLPAESVNCCVTSPPYWGLRDYGIEGQVGGEDTPEKYIARLVDIFSEVRRVLRPDGTLSLNLGDCYASPGKEGKWDEKRRQKGTGRHLYYLQANRGRFAGLKQKDLVGIPWAVAFALRDAGWYLRSDIIWYKPNAMPESVLDRPTRAHEYLFLLSKSERYYYDYKAIQEDAVSGDRSNPRGSAGVIGTTNSGLRKQDGVGNRRYTGFNARHQPRERRNKRSVWIVPTKPFPEAHFAVYPLDLIKPCILAGCPPGGTVLDPFGGSGTTSLAAKQLGRNSIYIDLNPAYLEMAVKRMQFEVQELFATHTYEVIWGKRLETVAT
ncbi:DNA methylase (plasmid) [Neomoorella glycerini]|uniref:Methyltransferase n=1 Tax=Neomoorella glycerini TaxID=55779 RepID=A0A6I5ZVH8_9FIRM|nr:site-specific DNA-methyltransferase [Moorella glycerini]QGP94092.1 DNA methylase [Moorella glycerini]